MRGDLERRKREERLEQQGRRVAREEKRRDYMGRGVIGSSEGESEERRSAVWFRAAGGAFEDGKEVVLR